MNSKEFENFKYDKNEETDIQLVYEDEDSWNEVSDESYEDENNETNNKETTNIKKRISKAYQNKDMKNHYSDGRSYGKNYEDNYNQKGGYKKNYDKDKTYKKGGYYNKGNKNYTYNNNKYYGNNQNPSEEIENHDYKKSNYVKDNFNTNQKTEKYYSKSNNNYYDNNYEDYKESEVDLIENEYENSKKDAHNEKNDKYKSYKNYEKYDNYNDKGNYKNYKYHNFKDSDENYKYKNNNNNKDNYTTDLNNAKDTENYENTDFQNYGYKNKKEFNRYKNSTNNYKDRNNILNDSFSYKKDFNKTYTNSNDYSSNFDKNSNFKKGNYNSNKYEVTESGKEKDFTQNKKDHKYNNSNNYNNKNKYSNPRRENQNEEKGGINLPDVETLEFKNTNEFFKNKKENLLKTNEFPRKGLFVESAKNNTNEKSSNLQAETSNNYTREFPKYEYQNNYTGKHHTGNDKNSSNFNNKYNGNKNYNSNFNNKKSDRHNKYDEDEYSDLKKPVFINTNLNQQKKENEESVNSNMDKNEAKNNNKENNTENNKKSINDETKEITNNLADLSIENFQSNITQIKIKSENKIDMTINNNTNISIINNDFKEKSNDKIDKENSNSIQMTPKKKDILIQEILLKEPNRIENEIQNCQKTEMEKVMRNMNLNSQTLITNLNNNNPNNTNNTNIIPVNPVYPTIFPNNTNNINNISNLHNIQINHMPNIPTPIKTIHGMPLHPIQNIQPNIFIPAMNPLIPSVAVNQNHYNFISHSQQQINAQANNFSNNQLYGNMNQSNIIPQQINPLQFPYQQEAQMYQFSGQVNYSDYNQITPHYVNSNPKMNQNENLNFTANQNQSANANYNMNNVNYEIHPGFVNSGKTNANLGTSDVNASNTTDGKTNNISYGDISSKNRKLNIKAKDYIPKKKNNQNQENKFDMPSPPIMNYPSINTYYNNMLLNPKQMNNIMPPNMGYENNYK